MTRPRDVPVEDCQPSQLFVDVEKLRGVLEWIDADDPSYDPLPVLRPDHLPTGTTPPIDAPYVLADGHTRALAATLCGADELRVVDVPPDERVDLDLDVYATCLAWCVDAGIGTPGDLVGRVVSSETHRTAWIERCRALDEHSGD